MWPVSGLFLARLPSHAGSGAAQVANRAARRPIQGKAARWRAVAIRCGHRVRFQRPKSPNASFQTGGRRKSRRVASDSPAIAGAHRSYHDRLKKADRVTSSVVQRSERPHVGPRAYAGHSIDFDAILRVSRNSSNRPAIPTSTPPKRSPEPRVNFTYNTALTGKSGGLARPNPTLSRSSGLPDRGVGVPPAVARTFPTLRSTWFAVVRREAKASCSSEVELEAEPFQQQQPRQR